MTSRTLASLALGGLVVFTAAGCAAITPQATTIDYSPSDGVNVPMPSDSPVDILNALIVADENAENGNLVATIVNTSDSSVNVSIDWAGGSAQIAVPAATRISLGGDDEPLLLPGIDTPPGASLPVAFNAGGVPAEAKVQVFDETLTYLQGLAPTPAAD